MSKNKRYANKKRGDRSRNNITNLSVSSYKTNIDRKANTIIIYTYTAQQRTTDKTFNPQTHTKKLSCPVPIKVLDFAGNNLFRSIKLIRVFAPYLVVFALLMMAVITLSILLPIHKRMIMVARSTAMHDIARHHHVFPQVMMQVHGMVARHQLAGIQRDSLRLATDHDIVRKLEVCFAAFSSIVVIIRSVLLVLNKQLVNARVFADLTPPMLLLLLIAIPVHLILE